MSARASKGFTLIEVAIVTLVLTLLLGGLLVPLANQIEQRRYAETEKQLAEIKEALIGFALANKRLPCPGDAEGKEITTASCDGEYVGELPSATLNVPMRDPWGRRFVYAVSNNLISWPFPQGMATVPGLSVNGEKQTTLASNVAAVVLSHGKNGLGATGLAAPATTTDEAENDDDDTTFVARTRTDARAGCSDASSSGSLCEFDDAVIWISPFVLFNRMAEVGHFTNN